MGRTPNWTDDAPNLVVKGSNLVHYVDSNHLIPHGAAQQHVERYTAEEVTCKNCLRWKVLNP